MTEKCWVQGVKLKSVCAYWPPTKCGCVRSGVELFRYVCTLHPSTWSASNGFLLTFKRWENSFTLIYFLGFHKKKALGVLFPCQLCKKHCCRLEDFKALQAEFSGDQKWALIFFFHHPSFFTGAFCSAQVCSVGSFGGSDLGLAEDTCAVWCLWIESCHEGKWALKFNCASLMLLSEEWVWTS